MTFNSLLTIITDEAQVASVLDSAIEITNKFDAHLEVLCIGVDQHQMGFYYTGADSIVMQEQLQQAHSTASAIEKAVRDRLEKETIKWGSETVVAQLAGMGNVIAQRARFSDAVLLPKPYASDSNPQDEVAIEAALFDGKVPVIVLPNAPFVGKRIVVAWNQSNESLNAIRKSLPLLQAAELVNIAIIAPPAHGPERSDPGGALSQWLSRHGVHAEISVLAKTMPRISDILARHAVDADADMIVMGAYGHSRFREAILGGATRNTLEQAAIPIFMAH